MYRNNERNKRSSLMQRQQYYCWAVGRPWSSLSESASIILVPNCHSSCCLRPRKPTYLPRSDGQSAIDDFLLNLCTKMPAICGVKLTVESSVKYPNPQLGLLSASILFWITDWIDYFSFILIPNLPEIIVSPRWKSGDTMG